jgi:ATP adenylyltransferase
VIPDHFILATTPFKEQTYLLEEDDIGAVYECLKAYRNNDQELFGFFNSGDHSGASQPHRHIQFLPVESMRSGVPDGAKWEVLTDSLAGQNLNLPFAYFASSLPSNPSAEQLHSTYKSLYEQACQLTGSDSQSRQSSISYNLGLTNRSMVLCPRVSEGTKIHGSNGHLLGPISLNGTILGGTLLVKSEEEWNAMRSDASKLKEVLSAIGIAKSQERDVRI